MTFTTTHRLFPAVRKRPVLSLLGAVPLLLAACGGGEQPTPAPTPTPASPHDAGPFVAAWTAASDDTQLQSGANGPSGILVGTLRWHDDQADFGTILLHPDSASSEAAVPHATGSTEAARLEIAVDPAADTAIGVLAHVDIDNQQGLVFAMNASGAPVGAPVAAPAGATLPLVQNGVATFLSTDTKTTTTTIFALAGGNVTPAANVMLSGHPVARLALSTGTAVVTSKQTEDYVVDALTLVRLDAAGAVLDEQPIGNTFAYSELEPVLGTTRNRDGSFAIAIVPDYQNGHGSIVRVDATGTVDPAKTASIALGSPAIALSLAQLDSDGFLVVALLAPTTGYALEAYRVREDGTTTVAPYLFPGQELVGGTSMVALPFEDHAVVVHDRMLPGGQRGIAVDALAASP